MSFKELVDNKIINKEYINFVDFSINYKYRVYFVDNGNFIDVKSLRIYNGKILVAVDFSNRHYKISEFSLKWEVKDGFSEHE